SAQHVSHLPPTIDPSTASMTATKPATLPSVGASGIHPSPAGALNPPTGIPPSLGTPKGVSQEPSDQWAARALDAIAPSGQGQFTSMAQPSHSAVSTPGLDIPGSFPRSASDYNTTGGPDVDVEYVKQVACGPRNAAAVAVPAVQNAVGYVQENAPVAAATTRDAAGNAAAVVADTTSNVAGTVGPAVSNTAGTISNTASNAAGTVSNTASNAAGTEMRIKPYVPAAVAGVLPSHATTTTGVARLPEETRTKGFPSNDDEGFTPLGKSAGAGALPGNMQESGVAMLPDERNKETGESHSTRAAPFHGEVTLKDGPPSGLPSNDAPEVCSQEPTESVGSTAAPSIDGTTKNASTMLLPGSKKQSTEGLNVNTGTTHGMGGHDPAHHHPRTHMGATLAEINTERSELGHPPADNRAPAVPSKDRFDSDMATTDMTHPTYGKDDGSKASAAGDNSTMGSSTLGKSSSPSPSSDSKGEKKPGFMSKLKGEVK
ncbi:hypothetical protein BKA70DRAFT_1286149, partial [Coprinopsis sp. MPI-PUGE-AT-0042]